MTNWQETEFGQIPEDWDYEPLENFFKLITYGFTNPMPTAEEGPYKLTAKDVFYGKIQYATARRTTLDAFENLLTDKSRPEINDVLITKDGSIGRVALVDKEGICISQSIALIRPNKRILPLFLKYLLEANQYQQLIDLDATGSTIKHIYITKINRMLVGVPTIEEQEAITAVLASLDDKIDLLHSQNKTLEALAQTLFRHWFIDGADDDWEEQPVSYFGDVICGKTPSKKVPEYFNGQIPFIKIPDMHSQTFIFDTTDSLTELGKNSQSNKTIPPRSISVSCIATVGLVTMNAYESQTNQQINTIVPHKEHFRYFLYLMMLSLKDELILMASGGTATLNLNTGNFSRMEIISPPEVLLRKFHEPVEPMFEKIFQNQTQIRTLEKLRDTLLPKLMSGEVRVQM